jgi:hypothetical protein
MKPAFIAAVALAATICLAPWSKAKQYRAYIPAYTRGDDPPSPAPPTKGEDAKPSEQSGQNDSPDGSTAAQWILVVVAGVTAGFIAWQAWETRRAAEATQRSVEATGRQIGVMERQANAAEIAARAAQENAMAAREAAEAAKANAQSARDSVEMLISKERARIRVPEPEKLVIDRGPFPVHEVRYKIFCYGTTPAYITEASATARMSDSKQDSRDLRAPMSLPNVLVPNFEGIAKIALVFERPADPVPEAIERGELFAHFYGFVKYRDVFGRDHETTFRYLWTVTDLKNFGTTGHFCYWAKYGDETENKET